MTGDRQRGGVCVHEVVGALRGAPGADDLPLAGQTVTVCATACFYGKTDDSGRFSVAVHQYLLLANYSVQLHINPRRAAAYLPVPAPDPRTGVSTFAAPLRALAMPAGGAVIKEDQSAQSVTQDGVTLTLAAGTGIIWSFEDAREPDVGKRLRPLRVTDLSLAPPDLAALKPVAVWAFGPFEPDFSQPARLSFENPDLAALPAGTAVQLFGLRGLLDFNPPGATVERVAGGRVSADGKRVDMDPGAGLRTLTWIALRK